MRNVIFLPPGSAKVQTDAPVIAVKLGEKGFYPIYTEAPLSALNSGDVSDEIAQAAVIGSMFGWDVPGAKAARDYFEAQP